MVASGKRYVGVVTILGVSKCTTGRHSSCRLQGVTLRYVESVGDARGVTLSSVGASSPATTSAAQRAVMSVFADDTKEIAGHSHYRR